MTEQTGEIGQSLTKDVANLKGHSYGITLCGKNHFGSFINGNAMRLPEGANLHQWLTRNEMGFDYRRQF